MLPHFIYDNLRELYDKHHYALSHIWNCDETEAQGERSGGGRVLNKKGAKYVYSIISNEREWLSVLCCIYIMAGG